MTAISSTPAQRPQWHTTIIFSLAFWLSSSLILDLLIMPELYASGMMEQPGFASASYSIFWLFNRLEVVCAALVLTGALVIYKTEAFSRPGILWAIGLPALLLGVALLYTYGLTPAMSAIGAQLDWLNPATTTPAGMDQMHQSYWTLEVLKLAVAGALLRFYYARSRA